MNTNKRTLFSWCLYDWASSAFNTVIGTFVYSVYFARGIVGDETHGAALWGYAIGAAGIVIALLSPFMGAIADKTGHKKLWLFLCVQITMLCTILLSLALPDPSYITFVLVTIFFATIAFELGNVFYNAMLVRIAPPEILGRISGWAWGLGYIGGLACLATALFLLVGIGEHPPLFDFPRGNAAHIRATTLLVGLWMGLFSLPLFLFYQQKHTQPALPLKKAVKQGVLQIIDTAKSIKSYRNIVTFLFASAFFRDGLVTLFAMGGLYAAGTFDMNFQDILIFAIGLNITAGIGAGCFAFLDDWLGSKRTLMLSLTGLLLSGFPLLFITEKTHFIILAMIMGVFVGPTQAASRSFMARLSPPDKQGAFFGFYAFTGKSIAFLGPLLFAILTDWFHSQRAGMSVVILFFVLGLALIIPVREKRIG